MENKVVNLELKTNVDESIAGLKALKRQLKDTAAGSEEFKKIYNQIDDLEDKIKSSKNASSDWVDSIANAGGPLGRLGQGINSAKVATQSFGGALKATGIGLIVSLMGGLVAAFSENEGAMKKIQPLIDGLKKAFQGVFRAVEPLFNTFVDLATDALPYVTKGIGMVYSAMMAYFTFIKESGGGVMKILKGVFTLDADSISAGIDQVGGSFKKTQTSYSESMKRFSEGSKELTQSEKDEAEKREENRKKALEKKQANEEKAKEKAIQKAKEEADALQKIKDEADKEAIRQGESYRNKLEEAEKAEKDAKKANQDALLTEQQLAIQKENEAYEIKKANAIKFGTDYREIETQHLNELNNINLTAQEKQYAADKIASDKKIADEQAVADAKKAIQESTFNNIASGIGLLKGLFEKNKGLQKALLIAESAAGIAKIIINTKAANAAAKLKYALLPGGVALAAAEATMNNVSAGIGIASTIAATAKGLSAMGGGGAPSSSGVGGATGGGAAAPQFNVVGASSTNQLAQTISSKEQQPLRTYVVSSDVSTAQSLDRNIIQSASIG